MYEPKRAHPLRNVPLTISNAPCAVAAQGALPVYGEKKLYACDNEHLMDLLNNKMQEIPGVVATETLISLEQSIKKEIPIRVEK